MELVVPIFLLLMGLILLIKGADWLIESASAMAVKFAVSEIVIGLTIVAFGTSTPELIVNVLASLREDADIALGNVIGSNIINILVILGITGTIQHISTRKNTIWREIPFSLMAVIALLVIANDQILNGTENVITRGDGIILLLFFIIFLTYSFLISKVDVQDSPEVKKMTDFKMVLFIILGLILLFIGGHLVVTNAIAIARLVGISEQFIALTIVAIGTSLPELFTSAVAAYKGKSDIAMGNVVGSNIFNIFFILGVSALIHPLDFKSSFNADVLILILASGLLFFTMFTGKKRTLDRWEAIFFIFIYGGYIIFLINRG
jgi:cation:H+ antiporter